MPTWEKLCPVEDIPAGESRSFPLGALEVLIFHSGKRFYACTNECPVGGEKLDNAELHGHVVECREHGCKTDLSNGNCLTDPEAETAVFPVEIRDGDLWVKS